MSAKAAGRSKTLTSPPQPPLAPVKFKAGLNFHLVNSFVNSRPGGNSVSVNISSLVLLALEEASRQLRPFLLSLNMCIVKWKQYVYVIHCMRCDVCKKGGILSNVATRIS